MTITRMSIRLNSDIYIYNNKYQIITFQFTLQMAELPYILFNSHFTHLPF